MSWTPRSPIRSPFLTPAPAGPEDQADDGVVRILTVCTGNICRSAYAQHVLQQRLDSLLGAGRAEVTSAGTGPNQALSVPEPILDLAPDDRMRQAMLEHRPRLLTARTLAGQDLVLAATQTHLDAVLREDPRALRRAFTLLEAGALLGFDPAGAGADPVDGGLADGAAPPPPAGGMAELTWWMSARHSSIGRRSGRKARWDLPDPFRGPVEGYAAMAQALDPALEAIAGAVARAAGTSNI